MKKVLLILMVFAASTTSVIAQKFGHIDSAVLMEIIPGADSAATELQNITAAHQAVITELEQQYEAKVIDFQSNPPTTEIGQSVAIQEIQNLEQSITEYAQIAQNDLIESEQRIMQPLIDKAKKAIEDVGAENGFTYIFDSSVGVLLYEGGEDVMPLVKAKLGIAE